MSAFQMESCFGADIGVGYFDMDEILDIFGIKQQVIENKRVKGLIKIHGRKERIVNIAIRQVTFDELRTVLETELLPYDPYFDDNKLLTSRRERLYDAQERFLLFCLSIASGKSLRSIRKLNHGFNTKELRKKSVPGEGKGLFWYFRQELDAHTREYILSYKARARGVVERSGKELSQARVEPIIEKETLNLGSKSLREIKVSSTTFDDEVITALKLFKDGGLLLSTQMALFKQGETLDTAELKRFCKRLIASYSRNPFALMAIRHIKDVSSYLVLHAMGMAVLGIHFAKAMKLQDAYIEAIALGALLFDLGRFRLPTAMVNKSTKMSDSEFDLFRKHIQFGNQILNKCEDLPKVVFQMLNDHHEKIDGSGYPNGKQDQEISVYGKIAAIIDAYDAMTSEQPHKNSMEPIKACEQMLKESGLAFDGPLLSVFLESIGKTPVGSCVLLSNGRVGFVLTLNKSSRPALIRQVYSVTNKAFIPSSDMELNKMANIMDDVTIEKDISPKSLGLQFINHIS